MAADRRTSPFCRSSDGAGLEADVAAEQHGQRLVLGHGDHVDALVVARAGARGAAGRAVVDDAVGVGRADVDLDVEQALVHGQRHVFAGDISGAAVDSDVAALDDSWSDQRDVAVLRTRVDLRARVDGHARGAVGRFLRNGR